MRIQDTPVIKKNESKADIVDKFFVESVKKTIPDKSEIIKNDIRAKATTFKEEAALKDVILLHEEIQNAWNCQSAYDVGLNTYKVLSNYLPGWVKFSINKNDNMATGVSGYGAYSGQLKIISKIRVPLAEQSVLRDILLTGEVSKGPLMPTLWNNFLTNRLARRSVCPEIIAAPIFDNEGVKEVAISLDLPDNFSEIKVLCLKVFLFQIRKIIRELSYQSTIRNI